MVLTCDAGSYAALMVLVNRMVSVTRHALVQSLNQHCCVIMQAAN